MASQELDKLDALVIEFFEKLEQLQFKRANINELMRDGNLSLSKSRYSMGNKCVGEIQFSHKMAHALYDIAVLEGENDSVFELQKYLPGTVIEYNDPSDNTKDGLTVRRRKVGPQETENFSSGFEDLCISQPNELRKENETKLDKHKKVEDPIKWFGVLVPSSLRNAQKCYQEVVVLCCDVANLENELRKTMQEFRNLKLKVKSENETEKQGQLNCS